MEGLFAVDESARPLYSVEALLKVKLRGGDLGTVIHN